MKKFEQIQIWSDYDGQSEVLLKQIVKIDFLKDFSFSDTLFK